MLSDPLAARPYVSEGRTRTTASSPSIDYLANATYTKAAAVFAHAIINNPVSVADLVGASNTRLVDYFRETRGVASDDLENLWARVFKHFLGDATSPVEFDVESFWATFEHLFEEEPLEAGMEHPAVGALSVALDKAGDRRAFVTAGYLHYPETRTALLSTLSRLPLTRVGLEGARFLLKSALNDQDIRNRNAAVQAIEAWLPFGHEILVAHTEPVSWLSEYMQRVLKRRE